MFGSVVNTSKGEATIGNSFNVGASFSGHSMSFLTRLWLYGVDARGGSLHDLYTSGAGRIYVDDETQFDTVAPGSDVQPFARELIAAERVAVRRDVERLIEHGDEEWGGGNNPIILNPILARTLERGESDPIQAYSGEEHTQQIIGIDESGAIIDWTTIGDFYFVLETEKGKEDVFVALSGDLTKTETYFEVEIPASVNIANNTYLWAVRRLPKKNVLLTGHMFVQYAPDIDT